MLSTEYNELALKGDVLFREYSAFTDVPSEVVITHSQWVIEKLDVKALSVDTGPDEVRRMDTDDLHDFTRRVSQVGNGVLAVRAEEGESGERHITTFIEEDSEELSEKIIEVQADIIESFPTKEYSFHIRVAPRDEDGKITLPDGPYYLLTWHI